MANDPGTNDDENKLEISIPSADLPSAYKVGFPPKKKLVSRLAETFNETFIGDEPFRAYKGQTGARKLILGLQNLFPILEWGRHYDLSKFKGDIIAGLTIAGLCVPQGIAYSELANLDPQYGLYTSFVPPLIYAVMGSSKDNAVGPVAVVSLLLGTLLGNEFDPVNEKEEYMQLVFTATFFAGITQAALGFFRLGFLIDFLSHAAIVGYSAGAAIVIGLQQLQGFLGVHNFTKNTDIISVMRSVWGSVDHGWNWQTIVIGSAFLAFLLFTKYIGKKDNRLFWIPVFAPLVSIVLSTFFVYITRADKEGVQIVRNIRKGINPSSIGKLRLSGSLAVKGFKIGAVAGMIALAESIAIGRTFAAMKGYQLDGNKEMVALGTMNIIGSMTSCFVSTGSFSRSAVNSMAGCQTAMSNAVMSAVVLLTLEFLLPLFRYTPNAILSSIIISAVIGLIDYEAAFHIWKIDKMDFLACIGAFFGVIFKSVQMGLLIAVVISFLKILLQVTRPCTAILGHIPNTTTYRNIEQYQEATRVPGVLIVRVDSALYFSSSIYVKQRILRWLRDEEEQLKPNNLPEISFLIIDMSSVSDIDISGIHVLKELYNDLQKREVELILANPGSIAMEKLHASKLVQLLGEEKIYMTVGEAVMFCSTRSKEDV